MEERDNRQIFVCLAILIMAVTLVANIILIPSTMFNGHQGNLVRAANESANATNTTVINATINGATVVNATIENGTVTSGTITNGTVTSGTITNGTVTSPGNLTMCRRCH